MFTSKESSSQYVYFEQNTVSSFPEVLKKTSGGIPNRKKRKEGKHINKHKTPFPEVNRACDFSRITLNPTNKTQVLISAVHVSPVNTLNLEKQGESEPRVNGGGLIRKRQLWVGICIPDLV